MSFEDRYIALRELHYKGHKVTLPKTFYLKEGSDWVTDGTPPESAMTEIFNELIKDPDCLFALIDTICKRSRILKTNPDLFGNRVYESLATVDFQPM